MEGKCISAFAPKGKVAGYYRLSIEDDDIKVESNSITNQRLLIKRFLAEHSELSNYDYCEFYDDGISGTTMNRPGIQSLLGEIRLNEIGCVIVKDLSRFSRDYIELGTYMEQVFPFMEIRFISITDCYDSNDYIGKTVDIDIGFKSLLADFYCKDISEKTRSSLLAKKNMGKYATGNTPFGYKKNKDNVNELLIVPEEAKVIKYIFKLALAGQNMTQICKTLNDENILTPLEFKNLRKKQKRKELLQKHKYWQQGTVRAILLNESYIGSMVYNKSVQAEVGGSRVILKPKEEWKVFKNHHESIIDKKIFDEVQKKFGGKKKVVRKLIIYTLKGKVYCGYCKRKMKVMKFTGDKLFYYFHNQKLNSDNECLADGFSNEVLDEVVLRKIKEQIIELVNFEEVKGEIIESLKIVIKKEIVKLKRFL